MRITNSKIEYISRNIDLAIFSMLLVIFIIGFQHPTILRNISIAVLISIILSHFIDKITELTININ